MNKILFILSLNLLAFSASSLDTYTQNLLLNLHNAERAWVGIANLTWDSTLAASAQAWAENLASTGSFSHSGQAVGENLAMASIRTNVTAYLFSLWSGEKKSFSNAKPYPDVSTDGGAVGHYTQIIWGRTYSVGCGIANTSSLSYLVCQYLLAGNYIGNYVYKASDVIYTPTSQLNTTTNSTSSSGSTNSTSGSINNSTSNSTSSGNTNSTSSGNTNSASGNTNNSTSNSTSSGSSGSGSGSNSGSNSTVTTGSNNNNNNGGKKNNNGKKGNVRGGSKKI